MDQLLVIIFELREWGLSRATVTYVPQAYGLEL